MNKEEKEMNSLLGKDSEKELDIKLNRQFKSFSSKNDFAPFNGFQLISAFIQILLGTTVVALSMLELIHPVWLATVVSLLGCVSIISGLILSYSAFSSSGSFNSLINKAIKRVKHKVT